MVEKADGAVRMVKENSGNGVKPVSGIGMQVNYGLEGPTAR